MQVRLTHRHLRLLEELRRRWRARSVRDVLDELIDLAHLSAKAKAEGDRRAPDVAEKR